MLEYEKEERIRFSGIPVDILEIQAYRTDETEPSPLLVVHWERDQNRDQNQDHPVV